MNRRPSCVRNEFQNFRKNGRVTRIQVCPWRFFHRRLGRLPVFVGFLAAVLAGGGYARADVDLVQRFAQPGQLEDADDD